MSRFFARIGLFVRELSETLRRRGRRQIGGEIPRVEPGIQLVEPELEICRARIQELELELCRYYKADGTFVVLESRRAALALRLEAAKQLQRYGRARTLAAEAREAWGNEPPTMKTTADWANLWGPRLLEALR